MSTTMSPPTPRKSAMSASAFAKLFKSGGHNHSTASRLLGVSRRTVIRWLEGTTPISEANRLLILDRMKTAK